LKENNTRIKFDDTSTGAGFPANDWMLSANEAPSGGANRFMLVDDTAGRAPFSVFAGAPADGLVITASGEVRAGMFVSQHAATLNQASADANAVLAGLRTLDLSTATFAADPAAPRHLGPTAHDFHLAFGLGADDGTIAPADLAGVALAAVKALDARVTAPSGSQGTSGPAGATGPRGPAGPAGPAGPVARWRVARLERRNKRLATRLARLERKVTELLASSNDGGACPATGCTPG